MTDNTPIDIFSQNIDRKWSGGGRQYNQKPSNYFDYFFSGEDVKVYIDGLFDPSDELDIATFGYSIQQQKAPIYGYWSYNYDTIMYGTRIVTGEFSVYTKDPRRITSLLEKAAKNRQSVKDRSTLNQNSIVSRMTPQNQTAEDELNLERYWSISQLDRVTTDPATDQINTNNIFSAHPPFNFIILYGAEETALSSVDFYGDDIKSIQDDLDRVNISDVNQRNIRIDDISRPLKTVLQQVNLISMGTAYSPGGQPVLESYQFMARDFYYSQVDLSFVKDLPVVDISDYNYLLDDYGARIEPLISTYIPNYIP
jgi:hypothetical protein